MTDMTYLTKNAEQKITDAHVSFAFKVSGIKKNKHLTATATKDWSCSLISLFVWWKMYKVNLIWSGFLMFHGYPKDFLLLVEIFRAWRHGCCFLLVAP